MLKISAAWLASFLTIGALGLAGGGVLGLRVRNARGATSVVHRPSDLVPQTVLNEIHGILHPLAGDFTQSPTIDGRHVKERILPTSAFVTASTAGFTTDCKNRFIASYRHYSISPVGVGFLDCGPGPIPSVTRSRFDEFEIQLTNLGKQILVSAEEQSSQQATSVRGNRQTITARYACQSLASPSATLVRSIVTRRRPGSRFSKTTVTFC
jgi:hypothetical protein